MEAVLINIITSSKYQIGENRNFFVTRGTEKHENVQKGKRTVATWENWLLALMQSCSLSHPGKEALFIFLLKVTNGRQEASAKTVSTMTLLNLGMIPKLKLMSICTIP